MLSCICTLGICTLGICTLGIRIAHAVDLLPQHGCDFVFRLLNSLLLASAAKGVPPITAEARAHISTANDPCRYILCLRSPSRYTRGEG